MPIEKVDGEAFVQEKKEERMEKQDTVQTVPVDCGLPRVIFIRATVRGLLSPLLPFALLKKNPMGEDVVRVYTSVERERVEAVWDNHFADVLPAQYAFVCAWNSVHGASPRVVQAAGLTYLIASCSPTHTRWLTTPPVLWNGELVMWCEAIAMHPPTDEPVVTLSESNMVRLTRC